METIIKLKKRINQNTLLKDCKITDLNKELITFLNTYIKNITDNLNQANNLLLTGNCGTGKTYILNAFRNELETKELNFEIIKYGNYAAENKTINIKRKIKTNLFTIANIIQDLRKIYNQETPTHDYKTYDLLIMDELGLQFNTDNERQILYDIIDYRYNNYKPTFLVSNIKDLNEIKKILGARLYDRLINKETKIIELKGESWR